MAIKQITIFIENRAGRLLEVTQLLADNKIDLRALNIAETTDYGLLRIIVDDTAKALNVLKENGAIATTTDVLAVAVPNVPGGLNTLLQVLATANVDVSYMYSIFGHTDENAYIILQLNDADEVAMLLANNGIIVATAEKLGIN